MIKSKEHQVLGRPIYLMTTCRMPIITVFIKRSSYNLQDKDAFRIQYIAFLYIYILNSDIVSSLIYLFN
jgi:hypothetical protein